MRFNIYNEHNELIGQDYQRNNGEWSHKWFDNNIRKLERGSWTGKAKGDNMEKWKYVEVKED